MGDPPETAWLAQVTALSGEVLGMTDGARPKVTQATHEAFSRDEPVVAGSDRAFGLVMAGAFGIVTLLNGWHDGRIWPWTGGVAALFLAVALLRPALLNRLNRLWLKFGLALHSVVNPVVMALLVLRHGIADRPGDARAGQGSAAAETAAGRGKLLDRTRASGACARDDEGSILDGFSR